MRMMVKMISLAQEELIMFVEEAEADKEDQKLIIIDLDGSIICFVGAPD